MDITLTTTPILVANSPVVISSKYGVSVLTIDGTSFTLEDDYTHESTEDVYAYSLVSPSSTIITVPYTSGNVPVVPIEKTDDGSWETTDVFGTVELTPSENTTFAITLANLAAMPDGAWSEVRKVNAFDVELDVEAGITVRSAEGDVALKMEGADGVSVFLEKISDTVVLISGSVELA